MLPHLKFEGGVVIPAFFSTKCFLSALRHKPTPGEIFIVTYPKCGTTWMQNVVINILRKGEPLDDPRDFFRASPFLDQLGSKDCQRLMIKPGAYKTHLPFHKVPWSTEVKYIYVARNPKDCCVSFYHHMRQIPGYQFTNGTFDAFFDLFIAGNVEYGDYFDHLISWYEHKEDKNVLFVTFEDMKKDLEEVVMRVARFLGQELVEMLKNDPDLLQKILENCNIKVMKENINKVMVSFYKKENESYLLSDSNIPEGRKYIVAFNASLPHKKMETFEFVRKGVVEEWKEYFNEEHVRRFDKRILEKTTGTNVMNLWKVNKEETNYSCKFR